MKKQYQNEAKQPERKEKCPPIFIKGNPTNLRSVLRERISTDNLKCTLKLCTDGLKLMADTKLHHYGVLEILQKGKHEFYTQDIPSDKPLKEDWMI